MAGIAYTVMNNKVLVTVDSHEPLHVNRDSDLAVNLELRDTHENVGVEHRPTDAVPMRTVPVRGDGLATVVVGAVQSINSFEPLERRRDAEIDVHVPQWIPTLRRAIVASEISLLPVVAIHGLPHVDEVNRNATVICVERQQYVEATVRLRCVGDDDSSATLKRDRDIVDHRAKHARMRDDGLEWAAAVVVMHHEVWLDHYLVTWCYYLAERVPLSGSVTGSI